MVDIETENSKKNASLRAGEGIAARLVALAALDNVLIQKKTLDDCFLSNKDFINLMPRDRAFVRLLVLTVLRRLGQIDALISSLIDRPIDQIKPLALLNILRLGAAQAVFLETPAHATVYTMVDLAAAAGLAYQKGYVNAVVRRMTEEAGKARQLPPLDAGRLNTPDWLWNCWVRDYGVQTALEIAAANMSEAPVDITVKENPELWAARLEAKVLPNGTLRRMEGGAITEFEGFKDGAWWMQSLGAALPARLFGDVKGKTIVDLCAAPGGKTAQLLAQGAKVIAVDRSAGRMSRLKENMERLGYKDNITTIVADGAVWRPSVPVDGVLLDAPCTATGTIRHQPDVLRLKTPEDMAKLLGTQMRLLENVGAVLKPGGILIYCTCSLQKAEGEECVDKFLESGGPFSLAPIDVSEINGFESIVTRAGTIRSLPFHLAPSGGIDGFFIARLIRR